MPSTALKVTGLAAAALLGVTALSACSSSSTSTSSTSAPASSAAASPSASDSVVAPIIVTEKEKSVTVAPGDAVVFNVEDPSNWTLTSSDAAVFEVVDGGDQGTYTTNPGGTALAAGEATVTFEGADGKSRTVDVTVAEGEADMLPPVMVDETATTATAKVGDTVVFAVGDPTNWTLASSDPAVFEVVQGTEANNMVTNPSGTGVKAGEAEVTFTGQDGKTRTVQVTITE